MGGREKKERYNEPSKYESKWIRGTDPDFQSGCHGKSEGEGERSRRCYQQDARRMAGQAKNCEEGICRKNKGKLSVA